MKKLFVCFICLLVAGIAFQACDDTKTYAEQLEEEDDAIAAFIRDSSITVISQSEFYANDSNTDLSRNEYVQLANGVYMQIVDKGRKAEQDTIKPNDIVLVRLIEYDLLEDTVSYENISPAYVGTVDAFRYTESSQSINGIFIEGMMWRYYDTAVPAGWLVPLDYVYNFAHVKLIVPSDMGHQTALRYVKPYYYDIQKYQFY